MDIQSKVQYIKYSHKWRPTQHKLSQIDNTGSENSICPFCGEPKEDDDHPYQCPYPLMRDAQMETIALIKKSMEKINTYPILTEVITQYLKSWMRQTVPNILQKLIPTLPLHKLLLEATKQQDEIGWDNLL